MKYLTHALLTLSISCLTSTQLFADTGSPPTPDAQQMEAFKRATTPGPEHKMLAEFLGKWNHQVKSWMKPDAQPEVSSGKSEIDLIMDGRFLRQQATGTAMGQPFSGLGITGYDNIAKKFNSIWLDNIGTTMMIGSGQFDKSKNAIVDQGSFSCPMSKTGNMNYRAVWSLPQNNSFKYEMYGSDENGKEFKMMEITYSKPS